MRNYLAIILITSALLISGIIVTQTSQGQNEGRQLTEKPDATTAGATTAETHDQESSPIYGVTIPAGYRDWKLIAVKNLLVPGKPDQLRAQLGNDMAIKAFKEGKRPFPDGAIIAAIHWTRVASDDDKVLDGPFPGAQSFVVGSLLNVQFMVKDSKKYAATGGWGFADFKDGKPGDKTLHETCFACHASAKDNDFVFTRYVP